MKLFKHILAVSLGTVMFSSCNDDFLEKYPEDKFTNETYWKSDNDFRTYALGLFDFEGFGVNSSSFLRYDSDESCKSMMRQDSRIWDFRTVPESGGGWSWGRLRSINIMVEHARSCKLDEATKNHWLGVARMFRAREYFYKVRNFGDVPWIGRELNTDSEELYKPKDPRAVVMDSVLADINFAVAHIRENEEPNQINKDVALAIKSNICLFEASFRKYHKELNLNDSEKWFRECADASEQLMKGRYTLTPNYRDLYSSLDLAGNPECILYRQYEVGVVQNAVTQSISLTAQSSGMMGATKDAIESYLCTDGLPYGQSPLHPKALKGEPELLDEEFVNRDPRMSMTFVVPFNDNNPTQLPAIDEAYSGEVPPFMPCLPGEDYIQSPTGYHPYKWWNPESPNTDSSTGITDCPIYALNKVLLNYAEAKAELGECTDDVLNKSINLLRRRVGMPDMTLATIEKIYDAKHQKYAPEISKLLWEIRRERQVELMLDGTRLNDILRWKKASWLSKPFVGCYIDLEQRPAKAYDKEGKAKFKGVLGDRDGNPLPEGATKGYILPYNKEKQPMHSDDELKVYYSPINTLDLQLNENLVQSPGWENE